MNLNLVFVPVADVPADWKDGRPLLGVRSWSPSFFRETKTVEYRVIWYERRYGYGWETHPVWSAEDLSDTDGGYGYYYLDFAPDFVAELPKGFPA